MGSFRNALYRLEKQFFCLDCSRKNALSSYQTNAKKFVTMLENNLPQLGGYGFFKVGLKNLAEWYFEDGLFFTKES